MNNNETNPLRETGLKILTLKDQEDPFIKVAHNIVATIIDMRHPNTSINHDWDDLLVKWTAYLKDTLQSQSLPAEQPEKSLSQLFDNNSDCYADTRVENYNTTPISYNEGPVIMAMTKEKFIEVVSQFKQPSKPEGEQSFNERNSELAERIEIAMEQNMSPIEMAAYLQSFEQPSQPGKTLEDCKDAFVVKYHYTSWDWILRECPPKTIDKIFNEVAQEYANQPRKEADIINLAKSCLFLGRRGYLNVTSDEDYWKDFMSHPDNVELLNKALGSQK